MSGEMGGGAIEIVLLFWFFIIAICFSYGLCKILQWTYNKRKPQKKFINLCSSGKIRRSIVFLAIIFEE